MNERFAEPMGVRSPQEAENVDSHEGTASESSKRDAVVDQARIKLEQICAGSEDPHEWTVQLMQSLNRLCGTLIQIFFPKVKKKILVGLSQCSLRRKIYP